ncbi:MAG: hypothetical protein HS111_33450 [Kofleriaceae bacterium]|nr:hypothetical protein [Kofleriaceae bacterium]
MDGEPLASRLRRVGRLPVATALHLGRQIADALAAAHATGIVHRDLLPTTSSWSPTSRSPAASGSSCSTSGSPS